MRRLVWLSHPLDPDGPHPPAIPSPRIGTLLTIAEHGANVQSIEFANHTGTHLDAPRHVINEGLTIHDWEPEDLIFTRPRLVDLSLGDAETVMPEHLQPHLADLTEADIALFRFGYDSVRTQEPARYSDRSPGFGVESAVYLRTHCSNLRAVGMDVPSLACIADLDNTMASHNILLEGDGRRFLVIEEMVLPHALTGLSEVRVSPWFVAGVDSGPATVVGTVEE